jgi:hypothetical protein
MDKAKEEEEPADGSRARVDEPASEIDPRDCRR